VLCFNCNAGKERPGGCPHRRKGESGGDVSTAVAYPACTMGGNR
jgi:hypothetical protein